MLKIFPFLAVQELLRPVVKHKFPVRYTSALTQDYEFDSSFIT